jgi:hypothetical protein
MARPAYKVFFKGDAMALEEPPHRGAATLDTYTRHCRDDLIKRHVGLPGDEAEQKMHMLIERRDTAAARLGLEVSVCA